jgi:cytochrome oxidase Cu insertion factor (SCO1/SenC/PrrC family)
MRNVVLALLITVTALCLVIACQTTNNTTSGSPVADIKVGNLAPDFKLKDLNGNTVSLYSLRGKPVMVNFWALDCP